MKKPINLGLIGAGEFGNFATKVIDILPGFNLYAVADTKEESALKLAKNYNSKVYNDYKKLLNDREVDIVLINTPNFLHAKMTIDALLAKKRVLCEKPLGINKDELIKVYEILKQTKGLLNVNYLLPNHDYYLKLKEIIASKKFGQLNYVNIKNMATEGTIKSPWYWDDEKSGGWFLTADIHFYDLINFLIGKPKLLDAKEYKNNGKTSAIYTSLESDKSIVNIFHYFNTSYKQVNFTAEFDFEHANAKITGWIPTELEVISNTGSKKYKQTADREHVYQKLVAKNIIDLSKMTHVQSLDICKKVILGSEIAFNAKKLKG